MIWIRKTNTHPVGFNVVPSEHPAIERVVQIFLNLATLLLSQGGVFFTERQAFEGVLLKKVCDQVVMAVAKQLVIGQRVDLSFEICIVVGKQVS